MLPIARVFCPACTARVSHRLSAMCGLGLATGLAAAARALAGEAPPRVAFGDFMQQLGYAPVQLEVSAKNKITTKGKLNGAKVTFVVDTGCSVSVVDKSKGKKLPRLEKGRLKLQDSVLGSLQQPDIALVEKIELGSLEFFNQPFGVLDLTMRYRLPGSYRDLWSYVQGTDSEAVLGGDFLLRHYAVLNTREACL